MPYPTDKSNGPIMLEQGLFLDLTERGINAYPAGLKNDELQETGSLHLIYQIKNSAVNVYCYPHTLHAIPKELEQPSECLVQITATKEWLLQYIRDSSHFCDDFFTGVVSKNELLAVHQLCFLYKSGRGTRLLLRTRVIQLLEVFFHHRKKVSSHIREQATIRMVEKILQDHLDKMLPSLSAIAAMVGIGESVMKRSFKLLYGKSVYHYYLARKMELGAQLLITTKLTTNDIAYRLGYEKPGNFIDAFKKHYGTTPGSYRKDPPQSDRKKIS